MRERPTPFDKFIYHTSGLTAPFFPTGIFGVSVLEGRASHLELCHSANRSTVTCMFSFFAFTCISVWVGARHVGGHPGVGIFFGGSFPGGWPAQHYYIRIYVTSESEKHPILKIRRQNWFCRRILFSWFVVIFFINRFIKLSFGLAYSRSKKFKNGDNDDGFDLYSRKCYVTPRNKYFLYIF